MGITVTGDQAGLSDKDVLAIMRDDPAVRAAVAKVEREHIEAQLQRRLEVLDQMVAIGEERKHLDAEIKRLRPKLETARCNYEELAAQNGELHASLEAVGRRESEASHALIFLGEGVVWDSVNRVQAAADNWRAELETYERQLSVFKFDIFDRRWTPPGRETVVARIAELKAKLELAPVVQKEIGALALARIAPGELVAKVASIMARLSEPDHE